jgi:hypothetical protein
MSKSKPTTTPETIPQPQPETAPAALPPEVEAALAPDAAPETAPTDPAPAPTENTIKIAVPGTQPGKTVVAKPAAAAPKPSLSDKAKAELAAGQERLKYHQKIAERRAAEAAAQSED